MLVYKEKVRNILTQEQALTAEISALKANLEATVISNREEELLARKKKFKIEGEVENWIYKYDQDMEEKQIEIDDIAVMVSLFLGNILGRESSSRRA